MTTTQIPSPYPSPTSDYTSPKLLPTVRRGPSNTTAPSSPIPPVSTETIISRSTSPLVAQAKQHVANLNAQNRATIERINRLNQSQSQMITSLTQNLESRSTRSGSSDRSGGKGSSVRGINDDGAGVGIGIGIITETISPDQNSTVDDEEDRRRRAIRDSVLARLAADKTVIENRLAKVRPENSLDEKYLSPNGDVEEQNKKEQSDQNGTSEAENAVTAAVEDKAEDADAEEGDTEPAEDETEPEAGQSDAEVVVRRRYNSLPSITKASLSVPASPIVGGHGHDKLLLPPVSASVPASPQIPAKDASLISPTLAATANGKGSLGRSTRPRTTSTGSLRHQRVPNVDTSRTGQEIQRSRPSSMIYESVEEEGNYLDDNDEDDDWEVEDVDRRSRSGSRRVSNSSSGETKTGSLRRKGNGSFELPSISPTKGLMSMSVGVGGLQSSRALALARVNSLTMTPSSRAPLKGAGTVDDLAVFDGTRSTRNRETPIGGSLGRATGQTVGKGYYETSRSRNSMTAPGTPTESPTRDLGRSSRRLSLQQGGRRPAELESVYHDDLVSNSGDVYNDEITALRDRINKLEQMRGGSSSRPTSRQESLRRIGVQPLKDTYGSLGRSTTPNGHQRSGSSLSNPAEMWRSVSRMDNSYDDLPNNGRRSAGTRHQTLCQDAFEVFERAYGNLVVNSNGSMAGGSNSSNGSDKGEASLTHTVATVVSTALNLNQTLRSLTAGELSTNTHTIVAMQKSSDEHIRSLTETLLKLSEVGIHGLEAGNSTAAAIKDRELRRARRRTTISGAVTAGNRSGGERSGPENDERRPRSSADAHYLYQQQLQSTASLPSQMMVPMPQQGMYDLGPVVQSNPAMRTPPLNATGKSAYIEVDLTSSQMQQQQQLHQQQQQQLQQQQQQQQELQPPPSPHGGRNARSMTSMTSTSPLPPTPTSPSVASRFTTRAQRVLNRYSMPSLTSSMSSKPAISSAVSPKQHYQYESNDAHGRSYYGASPTHGRWDDEGKW